MRIRREVWVGLLLLAALTTPAAGQDRTWQNKWYWGTQGGTQLYAHQGFQAALTGGAHWFITAGRSALYVAYDQQYFSGQPGLFQTLSTGQQIRWGSGQRFQATIYAVPSYTKFQIIDGGGFALQRVSDAEFRTVVNTARDVRDLEDATTKAALILSAAWQYRAGLRLAIFGQYQFVPGNRDFVIRSGQHTFNLGIRYVVTHSEEVVSTER